MVASGRPRRASRRQLRNADLWGSGPSRVHARDRPLPGALTRFALFAEVIYVAILATIVGSVAFTLPAALAAGVRHLDRYVRGRDTSLRSYLSDVCAALLGSAVVTGAAASAAAVFVLDITLASSGRLPGGAAIMIVGWVGVAAVGTLMLAMIAQWSPARGWRGAWRVAGRWLGSRPVATLSLIGSVAFAGVLLWISPYLTPAALGCSVFAGMAIGFLFPAHG